MFVCDERDKLLTAMRLRPRRRFFDAAASCLAQNDSVGVHGVPECEWVEEKMVV